MLKTIGSIILILGLLLSLGCVEKPASVDPKSTEIPNVVIPERTSNVGERTIVFEIVTQGEISKYNKTNPDFFVITNEKDWNDLGIELEQKLDMSGIDFQDNILIITFSGQKSNSAYELDIKDVRQKDNIIDIFARTKEQTGGTDIIASPYIVLKLDRSDIIGSSTVEYSLNEKEIGKKPIKL